MKLRSLVLVLAVFTVVTPLRGQGPREYVLAESDGLKAVVRVRTQASLADEDWLQVEITNTGAPSRIQTAFINSPEPRNPVRPRMRFGAMVARDQELPSGKYVTLQPAYMAATDLGMPDAAQSVTLSLTLTVALADGRSVSTPPNGLPVVFLWSSPSAAQLNGLREQAASLLSRIARGEWLSVAEVDRMRLLLMKPATFGAITLDQALAAVKQRQLQGQFNVADDESAEVLSFARRRWPDDPAVGVLYREWLATLTRETLADLALRAESPWDGAFVQPIVRLIEEAAVPPVQEGSRPSERYLLISRGLSVLDRHAASWSNDASIPPRLSKTVLQISSLVPNGFYVVVEELKKSHDRGAIAWLRTFLQDKTIDGFTSKSASMPGGVTPMRYCDLAANGILALLGEPEMVSPWGRAKAPATGVPPEWEDWDRKIVALQQRLDAMPNR